MHDGWVARIFDAPSFEGGLTIVGKTLVVYGFLILGLRLLGKRELGQMNIYDLVMIIVLGNAVQNAMMNNDNTLGGGVTAAVTLLIANRIFNEFLRQSKKLERVMVGEPVILLHNGVPLLKAMEQEGVTREQLMVALREHGMTQFEEAHAAILEVDGAISVVPTGAQSFRSRRHYKALRLP
jgi:uncharacterized membrane protein YcaP (DUF421 family)